MRNTFLLIKQSLKSLKRSKLSIFLLSLFLIICFWLIFGFSFLYSSLKTSISNLDKNSNLATAFLSTQSNNEPKISYFNVDVSKDYKDGGSVDAISPTLQDSSLLQQTTTSKVIDSINSYYESLGKGNSYFNNIWAYVSSPGTWNPTINGNTFKTYTSLLMGDNNHYITLNKNFATQWNKSKLKNYVDIWTLYKDGLPTDINTAEMTVNPLNLVIDKTSKIVLGQSLFNGARVDNIDLQQNFNVSHVLFDISKNQPVLNSNITPTENNVGITNNSDAYISSPGTLPNVNTNPVDWKTGSNGMPNWSVATPNIKGWSVNALYGRIYKSICRNKDMQVAYNSRIYEPKLDTSKLTKTQKIIASLINIDSIKDPILKEKITDFSNQFSNNKYYQSLIRNMQGCLSPKITILQPFYTNGDKQTKVILDNTLNKLSSFFQDIEATCLDPTSFLNSQKIKLIDIINQYTSINNIVDSLGCKIDKSEFITLQTSDRNQNYNVIAVHKQENPLLNKIVSNDVNKIYQYQKIYNNVQLANSFRKYVNFGLKYGWDVKRFDGDVSKDKNKIEKTLVSMQGDFKKIGWLLNQANFSGIYKNLDTLISKFNDAGETNNLDQMISDIQYCLKSLMFNSITYNNGMLQMSFKVPGNFNWTDATPINANYIDTSYSLAIVNNSFLDANSNKDIIPDALLDKLMKLSYKDFLQEINKINDKYLIKLNGINYLIVGKGTSADFAYPITNNYTFNKHNNLVLYLNDLGYDQSKNVVNTKENIWVGLKPNGNSVNLELINKNLSPYFNGNKFYLYDDKAMPNKTMYQSINFPRELSNQILLISLLIGILSMILCLVVLFMILFHIIKNNVSWIGLAISNGEKKSKFIFINWSSSLMLSLIVGFISGIGVSLTYPLLSFFFYNQWTIPINFESVFWIIPVIIAILFVVIYLGTVLISTIILNKRILDLIANKQKSKFEIQNIFKLFNFKVSLNSIIGRFLFTRFAKVFGITIIGLIIAVLVSGSLMVTNQLENSCSITNKNYKYSYAIDLFSPSIQGGGYVLNKFNNIPNSLDTKQPLEIYKDNGAYANRINLVINPYNGEEMTNMWLPDSIVLINELGNDLNFLSGKMVNQLALNLSIPYKNNVINLWQFSMNIFPTPVISYINSNTDKLLSASYAFYKAMDDDTSLRQSYYSDMKYNRPTDLSINPWTFDGKKITSDAENNMLNYNGNSWEWTTTGKNTVISSSLFSGYSFNDQAVRLITYLVTNFENKTYVDWCNKHNFSIAKPYWLGLNEISNESLKDNNSNLELDTYSYLDCSNGTKEYKITGINNKNGYIELHDVNTNKIINNLLDDNNFNFNNLNNEEIPLIISEVAAKNDKKHIGDVYNLQVNNNINRYTWKFNKTKNPYSNIKFKVVGIMSDKLSSNYWISQDIANQLLGYSELPINQRFNGVYYSSEQPLGLFNLASLYSPSGISTLTTSLPNTYDGMDESIFRNSLVNSIFKIDPQTGQAPINDLLHFNILNSIIDPDMGMVNYGAQTQTAVNAVNKINEIFGSKLINNSITNLNSVYLSKQFTHTLDKTISNFIIVFVVGILPILLCINLLLIAIMIDDINAILGLLLTQGYSKSKMILSFSAHLAIWCLLGIIIGSALSLVIPPIFNSLIWSTMGIITNSSFIYINALVSMGTFLIISLITWLYSYFKIKKTPLLALLSGYQLN